MTVITATVCLIQLQNDKSKVKPFSQSQLNDLVRDLALSKEAFEVLASRLSEHGIPDSKTK